MDWILSLKPWAGKSPDLPVSGAEITADSPQPSILPDPENRVLSRSQQGSYSPIFYLLAAAAAFYNAATANSSFHGPQHKVMRARRLGSTGAQPHRGCTSPLEAPAHAIPPSRNVPPPLCWQTGREEASTASACLPAPSSRARDAPTHHLPCLWGLSTPSTHISATHKQHELAYEHFLWLIRYPKLSITTRS